MMFQNQRLIEYLKDHDSISVAEAPSVIGVGCLTKRVSECRKLGHDIRSFKEEKVSPWGGIVRYNRYYLEG